MSSLVIKHHDLESFFSQWDDLFARQESRDQMRAYIRGLLSPSARKTTWQLAEVMGLSIPDGLQRLLYRTVWDADEMCRRLRHQIVAFLGVEGGVFIIDESGFVKKGDKSAGVARQYCGRVGKVDNCQVGVFLGYATPQGHGLLDRELYIPEVWFADRVRCRAAHIPEDRVFQTKPQLALQMLKRSWEEGLSSQWVVADSTYGNSPEFRQAIQAQGRFYVVSITKNKRMTILAQGKTLTGEDFLKQVLPSQWTSLATRAGEKGLNWSDWQRYRIQLPGDPIGEQWLLMRRHSSSQVDFFLSNAPLETDLETLVGVATSRHHIEEALQEAKGQVGLADYEVRFWHCWYRHITLALLAYALLLQLQFDPLSTPPKKRFIPLG